MNFFMILLCFVLSPIIIQTQDEEESQVKYTLGGIFYEGADDEVTAFQLGATQFKFNPEVRLVHRGEILEIGKYVCELAQLGVIGIIDGTDGRTSSHAQAVCDTLELPHVTLHHNDLHSPDWYAVNMFPSADSYNMLMEAIIKHKGWGEFTILYTKGYSLNRVSRLLRMGNTTDRYTAAVRELSGDDYRDVMTDAKTLGFTNFVVDCPSDKLELVLSHAQQVGIMSDENSFVFVAPDLFTLDLDNYRYSGANITGFCLTNPMASEQLYEFTELFRELSLKTVEPNEIKTDISLVYDAVHAFAEAKNKLPIEAQELSCDNFDHWDHGSTLLNFMRTNKFEGLTGTLQFDGFGRRSNFTFEVLELIPSGNQSIGTWASSEFDAKNPVIDIGDINENSIMANKTFKVLIATVPPYAYDKESTEQLTGNDRYEGFTVDLIDELSKILGFNYIFEKEQTYGTLEKGKWNGMVQQLREDKADFAICDFTITSDRQSAIDFSTPFMTLGIGILYKQPSKQPPEMFSFMAVFSQEVWMYMLFSQLTLGMIMVFVGRISHKEWQNPVPCVEQPEELSNQFSFANSVWLIIGSVMQQGSEIAPIALSSRLITSIWWFFTMIMVASYTGTLVAFLTVERNVLPFNTVEELFKSKFIQYGCKTSGSTNSFFEMSFVSINFFFLFFEICVNFVQDWSGFYDKRSLIHYALLNFSVVDPASKKYPFDQMFKKMKENNWRAASNDIGVERAENSQYAFFMESTSIEYYTERHCNLMIVGDLLDTKGYGIGMKAGSIYKVWIDDALLKLKEAGVIQKLKDKWWREKKGGGKCQNKGDEETKQLGMKNLLGAFVVLGVGCLIGLFISTLDMLWGVFKKTVKYKTTFKYELMEELKFALKFSGDVKPVRRVQKDAGEGSAEALAETELGDELRSLHSVRSARSARSARSSRSVMSGDSRRTSHSHSSRHSSSSLAVAFARRKKYS